ncbi:MAG: NOL1/NOP2/sun family putative RNA methylase, partial [Nanoarchaeota archaeon]
MEPHPKHIEIRPAFEKRYRAILGKRYDEFITCSLSYGRKSIRVNTLKIGVADLKKRLLSHWTMDAVPWCPEGFWIEHRGVGDEKRWDIGNLLEHMLGYIYVQDAASMIPVVVLDPKPGEIILDLCAAPGSKTSQTAQYMQNTGILVANDVGSDRLKPLGANLQRMGVANTIITMSTGQTFRRRGILFDRVLVDAPCSATGTIRKSYKTLEMWNEGFVRYMEREQRGLIRAAFEVLKPGGVMVYSTCTHEPAENERTVNWLLANNADARLEEITLPIKRSEAFLSWEGEAFDASVSRCLRIYAMDNDTEGFFVAKIRK